ncbi:MAG: SDR family oxidoreductase [Nitratireductor sp.]|nr:SDR family oxidoreductase [Nitratireductor sp.]
MDIFKRLFALNGKTALVTGGAGGIGTMISSALVEAGCHVMIASRKGEDCERAAAELNRIAEKTASGGSATGFAGNVANEDGVKALVGEVKARTDRLHILFNNAGTSWGAPLADFPYPAWSRVLDLNVTGLFELTRQLLPLLEKAATADDPARVVNLGSVMGTAVMGDGAYSYSASKAAVHHLTRILAKELAHRHITFNAFAPGPFPSKMTAHATATEAKRDVVSKSVPIGRVGVPDDIAAATLYLCGPGGAYVTGAILPIDGGTHVMSGPDLFGEAAEL